MQRRQDRHKRGPVFRFVKGLVNFFRRYRKWSNKGFVAVLLLAVALSMGLVLLFESFQGMPMTSQKRDTILKKELRKSLRSRKRKKLLELWLMVICFIMIFFTFQQKRMMERMIFMRILSM